MKPHPSIIVRRDLDRWEPPRRQGAKDSQDFHHEDTKARSGEDTPVTARRLTSYLSLLTLLLLLLPLSASAAIKQEIPPLRPPREEPLPPQLDRYDPLPWFIAAAAIGIIAAALAWPRTPRQKTVESPAARARRELQSPGQGGPLEISQILRRFLIAELGLPGEGVTTEEIHDALAGDGALSEKVTSFLSVCDAAKFAPAPTPPANLGETARALIEAVERRARATRALQAVQTIPKQATS